MAGRQEETEPRRLEQAMFSAVGEEGLLAPGRAVVVMYSGGRDSTCLLDLAVRIAGAGAVSALHVNYGLREGAGEDERHCVSVSAELGVQLQIRKASKPASGNVQAWAREVRYEEAKRLARAADADVATGHTASDQVETILYRLASSPSRRALLGMRPRDGVVVRPLLSFTREQTTAYCLERGLRWREDPTNELDIYARARVRGRLIEALRAVHPAAEANVLSLAEILRDEAQVLASIVDAELAGGREISLEHLRALPPALGRLVVQRLADEAAERPAPGAARRLSEIVSLSDHRALDLPHGVRAQVERGVLQFVRTPPMRS